MTPIPAITWSPGSWRDTERAVIDDILAPEMYRAIGINEPTASGSVWTLPYTRAGARRRHASRDSDIRCWIGEIVAALGVNETLAQEHIWRAMRAWAASEPGDIPGQWEHIPAPVLARLREISEILGCRGGAAHHGPIRGAIHAVLGEDGAAYTEHMLDRAIYADDWHSVRSILSGRTLGEWTYGSGDPLPPHSEDVAAAA